MAPRVAAKAEPWAVACTDPEETIPAWISNGHIGLRVGRDGRIAGPILLASSQDKTFEEAPLPLEFGATPGLLVDGAPPAPLVSGSYEQRLDFKTGTLTTNFECSAGKIETVTGTMPFEETFKQTWHFEPDRRVRISVTGNSPGLSELHIFATLDGKLQHGDFDAEPGAKVEATCLSGRSARSGILDDPWEGDIEIDGPIDDQQAIRSFLAYLRMAIPSDGAGPASMSPHGLSANYYLGHVFWDADIWVFPALALLDPERARQIPEYRIEKSAAAKMNATQWWGEKLRTGRPIEGSAKYPWQSATTGMETADGEFREAVHIDGAVLWGLNQAAMLGLADPNHVKVVELATGKFWRSLMSPRPGTKLFDIKHVFGIDEFRSTDNDLITNILAQWTLNGRSFDRPPNTPELYLPADEQGFQTYEGDHQNTFKQAGAVLSIFPYQFPAAEVRARSMMKRYADKIDSRGPAMTEAIHATIWARLGEPEKAYEEWKRAWLDFTGPLLLFSEHRNRDRSYFVTGAAGCLQTVLYGFAGIRIDSKKEPGAQWSIPLKGGWLSVKPKLPKAWKRITVRHLRVLGQNYTLDITPGRVQVKEGEP